MLGRIGILALALGLSACGSDAMPMPNQDLAMAGPDLSSIVDAAAEPPDLLHLGDGLFIQFCQMPSDCRLFSSYCKICSCIALTKTDRDPICRPQDIVPCGKDPCAGLTATCNMMTCGSQ